MKPWRRPVSANLRECKLFRGQTKTFDSDVSRDHLASEWSRGDAWCVGHAYDGLLWGRVKAGALRFSSDFRHNWGAKFRPETLTDLRIFNEAREMRVWRSAEGFRSCILSEEDDGLPVKARDTRYMLIHSPKSIREIAEGEFVELKGLAGQTHYPPGAPVPAALAVRTYFRADDSGIFRTFENRALKLVGRDDLNA
jgi:CRISPR-associated protein (TIGR03984 family)